MSGRTDVLIIGSGISSLLCAAILAKKGKSVRVLEQYSKPGGYMHCFSRFGVRFDTGAHYVGSVGPGQPFHTLLSYAGAYDDSLFVPLDPDGFDVFHFPRFELAIPQGYERAIDRLSGRFPGEAAGIRGFFERVRQVPASFPTYQFNEEAELGELPRLLETSLETVVSEQVRDPALRSVLSAYCVLHGVRPSDVSFGMHSIVMDSLLRGPYGLARGGDALAQKLVDAVRAHGGDVRLKKGVARIENAGRLATAVTAQDGERFEADWVVSGIDPRRTFELLEDPSALTPAFRQRMASLKMSGGIFGVYAACGEASGFSPRQNHYFFESDQDLGSVFDARDPGAPPAAVFLSPVDRTAESASRSGKAVGMNLHAHGPMSWFEPWRDSKWNRRPAEYEALKESYARRVMGMVDGFRPGFSSSVTGYVTSTPLSNLHFNGASDGAAYGIYHSIQNTGARALGPRTHVANLLLTGQSCLFPGLLGAAISGLRTAGHVVGIKPILRELRELQERNAAGAESAGGRASQ